MISWRQVMLIISCNRAPGPAPKVGAEEMKAIVKYVSLRI